MALIYLLRHAHSEANGAGILAGRASGVSLSEIGRRQADEIAIKLHREEFSAMYHSPMERCTQTLAPLAKRLGKRPRSIDEFVEMDYGKWTGRPFHLATGPKQIMEQQHYLSNATRVA